MTRTIEAIIDKSALVTRHAIRAHARRLTANWQTGFESGSHVQSKLRLGLTNVIAHYAA